jgi:hypothetical protein
MWQGIMSQLQQLLAQPLPLRQLEVEVVELWDSLALGLPSLAHLTQLTKLIVKMHETECAALPPQLQSLHLSQCTDLAHILALQQLQCLTISPDLQQQQQVLQLVQLPALQTLGLSYQAGEAAVTAAQTWVLLPQLRVLGVELSGRHATDCEQQVTAILAGAAAATQLTKLQLGYLIGQVKFTVPICGKLAGLTGIADLEL